MPSLSESMEEGTILKWMLEDGMPVVRGQELVEIETDKASMVHVAEADGTLEIIAAEGTTLPVGALIARIGTGAPRADEDVEQDPPPSTAQAEDPSPLSAGEDDGPSQNGVASIPSVPAAIAGTQSAVLATPLARRAAQLHEVALERLTGTGPRGRVTRADVLKASGVELDRPPRAPQAMRRDTISPVTALATASDGAAGGRGQTRRVDLSRQQQLIARRMAEAKATIPHFQVQAEVTMDAALELRAGLKQSATEHVLPSLNDLIVKACATALREHPLANGSYTDGGFELHSRINIGVAVASDSTLVVPVVMDADTMSLGAIARETKRLAERVRSGEIAPPELANGTFTVSNLGMFGMSAITPVVNPPQAAILGVGALRPTLARSDGEIVDRTLMTLTLSCDHRIIYGADAAWLLADIRALLEKPLQLLL